MNRSGNCISLINSCKPGARPAKRVFQILDEPEEPGAIAGIVDSGSTRILGDIRYQGVSFSYAEGLPALKRVSFHAPPSATIALVGTTGAGKSTLVNLLARFYEFSDGQIYVDEKPIRQYNLRTLRESVGVVAQESFLFNGSIRENLLMGKPDAVDAELWRAIDAANARQFIERLPHGLESVVGERGVKLSVGEKQRLSIARALLKDPPILILDEATASVDTETERMIQEALEPSDGESHIDCHRASAFHDCACGPNSGYSIMAGLSSAARTTNCSCSVENMHGYASKVYSKLPHCGKQNRRPEIAASQTLEAKEQLPVC